MATVTDYFGTGVTMDLLLVYPPCAILCTHISIWEASTISGAFQKWCCSTGWATLHFLSFSLSRNEFIYFSFPLQIVHSMGGGHSSRIVKGTTDERKWMKTKIFQDCSPAWAMPLFCPIKINSLFVYFKYSSLSLPFWWYLSPFIFLFSLHLSISLSYYCSWLFQIIISFSHK